MASPFRTALFNPRPMRSLVATARPARSYATIPTKNTTPSPPLEPSKTQAMPIGAFYEAILNSKSIPEVKPEEPATTVKETLAKSEPEAEAPKEAPKRGRKPKAASPTPKTEPAATATASTAPTASPAATAKATAKEAANAAKASSVSSPISTSTSPPDPGPVPAPSETATSTQEKAKVIFGTRLAGPVERAERLAKIRSQSRNIAGVLVPPKPEEPDNCCMSGCVNCVWDLFRDEMEDWAFANEEAERRLAARAAAAEGQDGAPEKRSVAPSIAQQGQQLPLIDQNQAMSMDDDGGGSDTNWENIGGATGQGPGQLSKDFWKEELYRNVPVGIREFMKQEKRLKEKHMREGTTGG